MLIQFQNVAIISNAIAIAEEDATKDAKDVLNNFYDTNKYNNFEGLSSLQKKQQ